MLEILYDVKRYFEENKIPKFRFSQFENAYFKQFAFSFDEISVFSKDLRSKLNEKFNISSLKLVDVKSNGDTVKFLFETFDKQYVEAVLMIYKKRRTVCVSSQIFCAMGCKFCATGANKYKRNLNVSEIVDQVRQVAKYLVEEGDKKGVTNVVYMGMGEPFLNYDNVVSSIEIFNDRSKFDIGARHITVSTCGIVPKIKEFINLGLQVRLAISLHASNDKVRNELMPINEKYPLKDLLDATDEFSRVNNKRVSFEYVLIKGVNDYVRFARELGELLSNRLAHVNLLVYNPHEFASFERPSPEVVKKFKDVLDGMGVECSIRASLGDNIDGACGQLSGKKSSD